MELSTKVPVAVPVAPGPEDGPDSTRPLTVDSGSGTVRLQVTATPGYAGVIIQGNLPHLVKAEDFLDRWMKEQNRKVKERRGSTIYDQISSAVSDNDIEKTESEAVGDHTCAHGPVNIAVTFTKVRR